MPTYITKDTISFNNDSFQLHGNSYNFGATYGFFNYQKTLSVGGNSNINLYSTATNGYAGYGFQGSVYAPLDDTTSVIDYLIAYQTSNNSITIYAFQSAYLYNGNTIAIDLTRITGGMYRATARWDGSGTMTLHGLTRSGGYSGSNWASPQTSDAAGNAFCFVNINDNLYLRQRKCPVTHGSTFITYSHLQFTGVSTLEPYAFNNNLPEPNGTGTGISAGGIGQGLLA